MAGHTKQRTPSDPRTYAGTFFDRPDELWDLHGSALFAMASALLGDESHALRAVTVGMVDLYKVPDPEATLRSAARSVYQQCQDLAYPSVSELATEGLPLMDRLRDIAWFQRSALALCFFGGLTYQEAAAELDIPADCTAWLLLSGLQELGRLAPGGSALR